ncbi:MAG: hypothetical protein R3C44_24735 [Chloroflexota bacterium]
MPSIARWAELARRSITLVKDDAGLLPLRLQPESRIVAVMPQPADLTPPTLLPLLHPDWLRHCDSTTAMWMSSSSATRRRPKKYQLLREQASGYDLLVVGTISANLAGTRRTGSRTVDDGYPDGHCCSTHTL